MPENPAPIALNPPSTKKTMSFIFNESLWSILTVTLATLAGAAGLWTWVLTKRTAEGNMQELEMVKTTSRAAVASATARAEEARSVAAKAEQAAAEAKTQFAQANAAAAKAMKEAAEARLESERLRTSAAWREISPTQRAIFRTLTTNSIKGPIVVESIVDNAEATNFARQISEMLEYAGFNVINNFGMRMNFTTPPVGVLVEIKSMQFPPPHTVQLQQHLAGVGIAALARTGPAADTEQVIILVGEKM